MTQREIIAFFRAERKRRHLLQRDLCITPTHGEEALSKPMVSLYERGKNDPTLSKAVEWARVLGYELTLVPVGEGKGPADAIDDGTVDAVVRLKREYYKALKNPTVHTPLPYALYQTWRWFDARKET